ncbi:MAG: hypothetical protein AAB474_01485 [Patescibacteria group bacterium]
MAENLSTEKFKEEIKGLEAALEAKKKEMAESGQEFKPAEEAKELIKEYTAEAAPVPPTPAARPQDDEIKKAVLRLQNEPHAGQIEEILKIARKNGISSAANIVRRLKNPHLLDDFHDRLVLEELLKEKNKE